MPASYTALTAETLPDKLGVIGFITKETQSISMGARGITFLDPVGPVQQAVDELHRLGIRRIIAVSHNGFKEDQYLAAQCVVVVPICVCRPLIEPI